MRSRHKMTDPLAGRRTRVERFGNMLTRYDSVAAVVSGCYAVSKRGIHDCAAGETSACRGAALVHRARARRRWRAARRDRKWTEERFRDGMRSRL